MPAVNFTVFVDAVRGGKKKQTIRALRKRPFKEGDTLYLYTGMRTANCQKIAETPCTRVRDVRMDEDHVCLEEAGGIIIAPWGAPLVEALSMEDGFSTSVEMREWFEKTHGFPFEGQVINWEATWL